MLKSPNKRSGLVLGILLLMIMYSGYIKDGIIGAIAIPLGITAIAGCFCLFMLVIHWIDTGDEN